MSLPWWNTNYPIRRNVNIVNQGINELKAGSPVYTHLDFLKLSDAKKVRDDFEDIEVLYWNDTAIFRDSVSGLGTFPVGQAPFGEASAETPSNWILLPRTIEYDSYTGLLTVIFNTIMDIEISDVDNYFIYMCNITLDNQPFRPLYESTQYSKVATPFNSGIMFTKPTDDWSDGTSLEKNAKAAFSFYGKNARIVFESNLNRGIIEVRIDNDDPIFIDTFTPYESGEYIYTITDLPVAKHYIRFRATGDKNPSSGNPSISIKEIQYSDYVLSSLDSEEIYSTSDTLTTIVGI